MATYKHGIYVSEKATSLVAPITGTAGLQVIVGTAPVNMAADPSESVNVPFLCNNYAEAVKAVGYCDDFDNYTLCQSIYANFNLESVGPVILINVLDPSRHKTDVPASDMTVTNGQVSVYAISGSEKQYIFGVITSSVIVKAAGGTGSAYIQDTDYTLGFNDAGYCIITPISTVCKAATSLSIAYSKLDPSAVTQSDIIGTVNATTGKETGLQLIREIYPLFGLTPGLIVAPGWSHIPEVAAVMQAKCESIDGCFTCETVLDLYSGTNDSSWPYAVIYSGTKTAKEALGATSAHAVLCWPKVKVGKTILYMSAVWAALTAYTDAHNSDVPNLSPSNKALGVTAACLSDGTEVLLDQDQANTLNSFGICTVLNHSGYRTWGNNTCAYPNSTDPKDRWWCCRRFFSWAGNSFVLTYFQKVDNPANRRLIESIVDSENIKGNGYVAKDYCAAYRLEYLDDENPVTDLLNGKVTFHQYLAPYTPAEDIDNILEFDTDALSAAIGGE